MVIMKNGKYILIFKFVIITFFLCAIIINNLLGNRLRSELIRNEFFNSEFSGYVKHIGNEKNNHNRLFIYYGKQIKK